jgi:foldase protein PrsA
LAARVNGQPIFLTDFERRLSEYVDAMVDQGLEPGSQEGQAQLAQAESDVLESLIDYALVEQGGSLLGVSVGAEEVDAQFEQDINEGGGQDAFDEWLALSGLSADDYRQMLRESLVVQRVMDVIAERVPEKVEHAHVRHIVVGTLQEAEQLLTRLRDGADFGELAREHSEDESTRDDGGDLGWFPRGLLAPELEEAAFSLEKGQFSGVILLGEGYHIIQLVDRDIARELASEVRMDLLLALFDGWLEEQRSEADIERYVTD